MIEYYYTKKDKGENNMKRVLFIVLSLVTVLLCTACHQDDSSAKTSSGESSGVQSQEESSEPEPDTLLAASFGKLYKGQTYYIETDMKVESISSSGSSSYYHMTIAIDKSAAQGMLSMTIENGSENHIIIRDGQSYNLNDTLKTYTVQAFEDSIDLFAGLYTSELYLGLTKPLTMTDTGHQVITLDGKEKNVIYEKYKMAAQTELSGSTEDAYITYYFDDGKPCMEMMEAVSGKTTFIFRQISDQIPDKKIFDIPAGYTRS